MLGYLPKKELIFFTPGSSGSIYTLPSKKYITIQQLLRTQEYLVNLCNNPVVYIEERRSKNRSKKGYDIKSHCRTPILL